MVQRILVHFFLLLAISLYVTPLLAETENPDDLVRAIMMSAPGERGEALAKLEARGKQDVIASLILVLRFRGNDPEILELISKLAGSKLGSWFDAMVWQQEHPEAKPHKSYRPLKVFLYSQIDRTFLRFIGDDRARAEHLDIRLEEITWGGVKVGGIPELENPATVAADQADFLLDSDVVFGAVINSHARAYPLRILGWHEMANDVIGGVPVSLAYCTLCGTGVLYETEIEGQSAPFTFGSSGLLYRSNKLMFDHQTDSLWNQFTGRPVSGKLHKSGLELKVRPMVVTSWAEWKKLHPETTVLSLTTGYKRDYGSGKVYQKYFSSPDLMFPVQVSDRGGLAAKDRVFGITQFGFAKAWPLAVFENERVINDHIGQQPIVLIGDPQTQTVRAYTREKEQFRQTKDTSQLTTDNGLWTLGEDFIIGPQGQKLPRLPGRLSYWFAWNAFMGVETELYTIDIVSKTPEQQ